MSLHMMSFTRPSHVSSVSYRKLLGCFQYASIGCLFILHMFCSVIVLFTSTCWPEISPVLSFTDSLLALWFLTGVITNDFKESAVSACHATSSNMLVRYILWERKGGTGGGGGWVHFTLLLSCN